MRTYDGIYLVLAGNRQGTINFFYLETGKVKKPRTIVSFPVPDRVITTVKKWGRSFEKETRIHKIYFLNRHKDKYAWFIDDLDESDIDLVEEDVSHPLITAKMEGVVIDS